MGRYIIRRLLWVVLVVLVVIAASRSSSSTSCRRPTRRRGSPASSPPRSSSPRSRSSSASTSPCTSSTPVRKRLFLGDEYGWPGLGFSYDDRGLRSSDEIVSRVARSSFQLAFGAAASSGSSWASRSAIVSALKRRDRRRPRRDGLRAVRRLGAGVLARAHGPLHLLAQARDGCRGRATCRSARDPSDWFTHMILPWIVLALLYAAFYARMVAREPDRDDGRGLHPHGAGQGPVRAQGRRSSTASARA